MGCQWKDNIGWQMCMIVVDSHRWQPAQTGTDKNSQRYSSRWNYVFELTSEKKKLGNYWKIELMTGVIENTKQMQW